MTEEASEKPEKPADASESFRVFARLRPASHASEKADSKTLRVVERFEKSQIVSPETRSRVPRLPLELQLC